MVCFLAGPLFWALLAAPLLAVALLGAAMLARTAGRIPKTYTVPQLLASSSMNSVRLLVGLLFSSAATWVSRHVLLYE